MHLVRVHVECVLAGGGAACSGGRVRSGCIDGGDVLLAGLRLDVRVKVHPLGQRALARHALCEALVLRLVRRSPAPVDDLRGAVVRVVDVRGYGAACHAVRAEVAARALGRALVHALRSRGDGTPREHQHGCVRCVVRALRSTAGADDHDDVVIWGVCACWVGRTQRFEKP